MAEQGFQNIRVVVGDPSSMVRQAIKTALYQHGFRNIGDASRLPPIVEAVEADHLDLIICDTGLEEGDLCALTHAVRHHEIGRNPFIVVIAMVATATAPEILRIIDSGCDDVIAKPVSAGLLLERVTRLARRRKEFVITSDYIGPNRRKDGRVESDTMSLVDVPNPLKARITGGSANRFQQWIDEAARVVNEKKMQRQARYIATLVQEIGEAYQVNEPENAIYPLLDRLVTVSEDVSRRLRGSRFDHVGELCQSMVTLAHRVRSRSDDPSPVDLRLMPEVADAIRAAFAADQDAGMALDISASVRRHAGDERA